MGCGQLDCDARENPIKNMRKTFNIYDKRPLYKIWVEGKPISAQKKGPKNLYMRKIQDAAKKVVKSPWRSKRIDVEIWFAADTAVRPDVDNIAKPILDALEGVVYVNDSQVRSVRVGCIPRDDAFEVSKENQKDFFRLLDANKEEFLINVFYGISFSRDKKDSIVCYPRKMFTDRFIKVATSNSI